MGTIDVIEIPSERGISGAAADLAADQPDQIAATDDGGHDADRECSREQVLGSDIRAGEQECAGERSRSNLLTDLNRTRGTTIVMVLHDLNMAARYADHLIALAGGGIRAAGEPVAILTADVIRDVFGIDSQVIIDPVSGKPLMLPIGRHHVKIDQHARSPR